MADVKRIADELQKKVRESESMLLAKDRIINDLRMQVEMNKVLLHYNFFDSTTFIRSSNNTNYVILQVPTSVDRAVAMASVTGGPGLAVSLTEDYESKQALSIAQSTVASLRERLAQKEETLEREFIRGSRSDDGIA